MDVKEYLFAWLDKRKALIDSFRFDTEQPGNLKSNRELYAKLIVDLDIELDRKEIFGLIKLYKEKQCIDEAFCKVCGKLCKCKGDYSFYKTCSKECGRILAVKTSSMTYSNKTLKEKEAIKEKRANTNLKKYGVITNLQNKDMIDDRIKKYGANTAFASKEIRDKIIENNKKKHNGQSNSFQWEETKNKIKQTKLERYDDKHYNNLDKARETCVNKYGTESYMSTLEFKEKSKEFFMKNFGVDHPMKAVEIVEKIKHNNNAKYGKNWYMGSEEFKEQTKEWCLKNYNVEYNCMHKDVRNKSTAKSKINEQWKAYLDPTMEEEFSLFNYSYDFKKDNILIEINPTITHNSTLCIFSTDKPKDPLYHQNKTRVAANNNYRCIHVWDWDEPEKIKFSLLNKKNIYARKCTLKEVSKKECDNFLTAYHFQNTCRGQSVRLGLYIDDELIEIMTFGKPRYNKKYEWELLRLCSKPDKIVIGGAEKLFNRFKKQYLPKSIISYCDMSKFTGNIYLQLKFELLKEGKPSKHWYNIKTHQPFTDNILRQQGADRLTGTSHGKHTSNEQIMLENHFLEVWDSGQNTYLYTDK